MLFTLSAALLLPFLGTALGSAGVFFLGTHTGDLRQGLSGFAAGVMSAASVWSLILPALERSAGLGRLAFIPALAGVWAGFLFLNWLDRLIARNKTTEFLPDGCNMLVIAVALHNLPEGMAVGAAAAAFLSGSGEAGGAGVLALSLGIALQNLPEGAIISMPLGSGGMGRGRAFGWGVLSGAVEPLGAIATLLLAELLTPALPFLLSFSAGAMLCATVGELIPDAAESPRGDLLFAAGFGVMMALDVALG